MSGELCFATNRDSWSITSEIIYLELLIASAWTGLVWPGLGVTLLTKRILLTAQLEIGWRMRWDQLKMPPIKMPHLKIFFITFSHDSLVFVWCNKARDKLTCCIIFNNQSGIKATLYLFTICGFSSVNSSHNLWCNKKRPKQVMHIESRKPHFFIRHSIDEKTTLIWLD